MKKKHIAALAGIAAVFAVGGSLAYFNQDLEAVNVLKSGDFDTEIVEEFRPEDGKDWKPGTTVNKDFAVKNSGDVPMVERVSFQETWERMTELTLPLTQLKKRKATAKQTINLKVSGRRSRQTDLQTKMIL